MLYDNHPHFVGFVAEPPQRFELYADELELLSEAAKKSGKKELIDIMQRLARYGRSKANNSHGPVRFTFK